MRSLNVVGGRLSQHGLYCIVWNGEAAISLENPANIPSALVWFRAILKQDMGLGRIHRVIREDWLYPLHKE